VLEADWADAARAPQRTSDDANSAAFTICMRVSLMGLQPRWRAARSGELASNRAMACRRLQGDSKLPFKHTRF
jgi:hypothetical protein